MSVPCLQYPSRSAAIVALMEQGLSDQAIAAQTGAKMLYIYQIRHRLKHGKRLRRYVSVRVDTSAVRNLKRFAEARGIPASELASRVLTEAVRSNLVDAVLDDGVALE